MISEARKRATAKYHKTHLKRIALTVQKKYYDTVLLPAIERSGESINGFIKRAIAERIERETK